MRLGSSTSTIGIGYGTRIGNRMVGSYMFGVDTLMNPLLYRYCIDVNTYSSQTDSNASIALYINTEGRELPISPSRRLLLADVDLILRSKSL